MSRSCVFFKGDRRKQGIVLGWNFTYFHALVCWPVLGGSGTKSIRAARQTRAMLDDLLHLIGSESAKFGRIRRTLARLRATLVRNRPGRIWPKMGQVSTVESCRTSRDPTLPIAQFWSTSGQLCPVWSTSGQLCPVSDVSGGSVSGEAGQAVVWPDSAGFGPILPSFGRRRAYFGRFGPTLGRTCATCGPVWPIRALFWPIWVVCFSKPQIGESKRHARV